MVELRSEGKSLNFVFAISELLPENFKVKMNATSMSNYLILARTVVAFAQIAMVF